MKDLMIDCHLAAVNRLDPHKRPGAKFEIVGFDFILDEDLRVWLIEVNTCPFMGPVLTAHHQNFMLDMLDDTFKLTIDPLFHAGGKEQDLFETLKDTEYELLYSAEKNVNLRSTLGLLSYSTAEQPYSAQYNLERIPINECSKRFLKYRKRCKEFPEFPASLYPSSRLH